MEASSQDVEAVKFAPAKKSKVAVTSYIPEGVNVTNVTSISVLDTQTISYLNASKTYKATNASTTTNTATFVGTSILQPPASSQLPSTTVNDFKFFANGVFIDATHVVSFTQVGSNTVLTINTGTLGYAFDTIDEIIAVGKFE
jgi:hypothetical protein